MPDPIDQTTTNPQSLVDAALGTELVVPEPPVTPPPLAPLAPLAPPVAEPVVPMGDDTPLAFAMPTPTPTISAEPVNMTAIPDPGATQTSSYLPPVPPAPTMAPEMPKKKSKTGLIIGGVVALLLFVFGGIAGYQYISTGSIPLIAGVDGGMDTLTGRNNGGNTAVITTNKDKNNTKNDDYAAMQKRAAANAATQAGRATTPAEADAIGDAAAEVAKKDQTAEQLHSQCDLQGATWDEAKSSCTYPAGFGPLNPPNQCLAGDDCPIICTPSQIADTSNWTKTQEPGGGSFCNPNGSNCNRYRVELKNGNTHCFLYYGENCGEPESCGPGGDNTKTTAPTMSCTGLNYTPTTTPVIGSVLTFTCTGAVVPSTAGTLSYKYRYNINSGAYTAMTSNTLTIAACGTYSVECQACATLGGVLKCDPIWTGATTP